MFTFSCEQHRVGKDYHRRLVEDTDGNSIYYNTHEIKTLEQVTRVA